MVLWGLNDAINASPGFGPLFYYGGLAATLIVLVGSVVYALHLRKTQRKLENMLANEYSKADGE